MSGKRKDKSLNDERLKPCPGCSNGLSNRDVVMVYSPKKRIVYRCKCGVETPTAKFRRRR